MAAFLETFYTEFNRYLLLFSYALIYFNKYYSPAAAIVYCSPWGSSGAGCLSVKCTVCTSESSWQASGSHVDSTENKVNHGRVSVDMQNYKLLCSTNWVTILTNHFYPIPIKDCLSRYVGAKLCRYATVESRIWSRSYFAILNTLLTASVTNQINRKLNESSYGNVLQLYDSSFPSYILWLPGILIQLSTKWKKL